jgi:excisionase family DNA binding protein
MGTPVSSLLPAHLEGWRDAAQLPVRDAGRVLGLSPNTAYAAARRGEIPTIRIGRRLLVPVTALRRLLGEID